MSIKIVKVRREIHTGATPGTRYLNRVFRTGNAKLDDIASEIEQATTVSYSDVLAVLKALEITVSRHVLNGEGVKLGLLGAFLPGIKATAKTTLAQVDVSTIQRAYCRFYPSSHFKEKLDKATFEELNLDITGLQSYDAEYPDADKQDDIILSRKQIKEIRAKEKEAKEQNNA
ncbi:MAG: hypothetical protein LBO06_00400 [Bacteroidales bacterium]|jgi:predicted histone-like DNA-binding protein|nr:hypothetical protein [Bacteroidales bacterium]